MKKMLNKLVAGILSGLLACSAVCPILGNAYDLSGHQTVETNDPEAPVADVSTTQWGIAVRISDDLENDITLGNYTLKMREDPVPETAYDSKVIYAYPVAEYAERLHTSIKEEFGQDLAAYDTYYGSLPVMPHEEITNDIYILDRARWDGTLCNTESIEQTQINLISRIEAASEIEFVGYGVQVIQCSDLHGMMILVTADDTDEVREILNSDPRFSMTDAGATLSGDHTFYLNWVNSDENIWSWEAFLDAYHTLKDNKALKSAELSGGHISNYCSNCTFGYEIAAESPKLSMASRVEAYVEMHELPVLYTSRDMHNPTRDFLTVICDEEHADAVRTELADYVKNTLHDNFPDDVFVVQTEKDIQLEETLRAFIADRGICATVTLDALSGNMISVYFSYRAYDSTTDSYRGMDELKAYLKTIHVNVAGVEAGEYDQTVLLMWEEGIIGLTPQPLRGDINNDGKINALDAQLILHNALDLMLDNETEPLAGADIDGDSEVTSLDAQYILLFYLRNDVLEEMTMWKDIIQ